MLGKVKREMKLQDEIIEGILDRLDGDEKELKILREFCRLQLLVNQQLVSRIDQLEDRLSELTSQVYRGTPE